MWRDGVRGVTMSDIILVPWEDESGDFITDENGEILEFAIDYAFYFLTSPRINVYQGQVYNYDVLVTDNFDLSIDITAETKPSDLSFIQISNTTARLSGSFSSIGTYDVVLSANDGVVTIYQRFTIEVVESPFVDESSEDLGNSIIIAFED